MILQLDWDGFILTPGDTWMCGTDSARNMWATDIWWLYVKNSPGYTQGQLIYGWLTSGVTA